MADTQPSGSPLEFAELADWRPVLESSGLSETDIFTVATQARIHDVPFAQELRCSGRIGEAELCHALSTVLKVPVVDRVEQDWLKVRDRDGLVLLGAPAGSLPVSLTAFGPRAVALALDRLDLSEMKRWLATAPSLARRIRIAPPGLIRQALLARFRCQLAAVAVGRLWNARPALSARHVLGGWQAFAFGALAIALPIGLALHPRTTTLVVHMLATLFFMGCVGLRIVAASEIGRASTFKPRPFAAAEMPVYSILVPLYKEAQLVPELLVALGRLVWPRSKLEIKLVCEADDGATLGAIAAHALRPGVEVIAVPNVGPRTKPKALAYALQATSGQLVVVYDAEDRPHPLQLIEAWQAFGRLPERIACLQAPLSIANGGRGFIAGNFAFEYAGLFGRLLPWLSARGLVMPLGGTSNHFRRSALERVGGWDPFNVTEDADLGVRLARFGLGCAMITSPTLEDAPETFRAWLPQRARWLKGWMQTWLVHTRNPGTLLSELGPASFMVVQAIFAGVVVSSLVHPLMLVTAIWLGASLAWGGSLDGWRAALLALDGANIGCAYASYLALGQRGLAGGSRPAPLWRTALRTPAYWIAISAAAWWALFDLTFRPHHWAKTEHRPSRRLAAPAEKEEERRPPSG